MTQRRASGPPGLPALQVVRGIALMARFRPEGLARFGGTVADVLSSLAPLLAFPAVFLLMLPLAGGGVDDIAGVLSLLDALLVQLVVSEALARRWGREADWGRYAVAFNWAQWAVPPAALVLTMGMGVLVGFGLPVALATPAAILGLVAYALAMQWFVARHALGIGRVRAAALVIAVNLCTALVVALPTGMRALLQRG